MALSTINTNSIADDAVTVPKVTDQVLTHRNLIINGAMQVAQRGNVAVTQAATAYGGADRWLMYPNISGSGSSTIAQTAVTWTESKFAQGFTATTTLSGGEMLFIQRIESKNTSHLANNKVTLQFKLAHDVGSTLTVQLLLQRPTTTADDFSAVTDFLGATTIGTCPTGTSSGTLFTYTSNTLTSADVSKGFQIQIRVLTASAVTNKNFYLGDVQLEVGDTATPFEHRSYGDELARCQRYYWQLSSTVHGSYPSWIATAYSTTQLNIQIPFPVTMRSTPTMTYNTGNVNYYRFYRNSSNHNFGTVGTDTVTSEHINMYGTTTSSHTAGTSGTLQIRMADGAGVFASAEL